MKTTILAFLTVLSPLVCCADDIKPMDVKVGLWETSVKTDMNGMPAMASMPQIPADALAKMPPEQRARIEAMMKGRGAGGPGATTVRSCITKDTLNRGMNLNNDKSCTSKLVSSSATKQEIHMDCSRGEMKMSGDMTVERVDSEHVKGNMVMKAAEGGNPMNVKMSFDTKFISSDCGDVKPAGAK